MAALAAFLLAGGVVVGARLLDAVYWQRSLVRFTARFPANLTTEEVAGWLATVAALTHAPRGALLPAPPVVIEAIADNEGVRYVISVPEMLTQAVFASLRAALPGARLEAITKPAETSEPLTQRRVVARAASVRLAGRHRQLAIERAEASGRSLLAALQPLREGEQIIWQWIVTGAPTPAPIQQPKSGNTSSLPWWLEGQAPADSDELRSARLKQREPLLHVTARLVTTGQTRRRAQQLFGTAWGGIRLLNLPGVRLVRDYWPSPLVRWQAARLWLPLVSWPLRLNAPELAGLLALPVGDQPLPGVAAGVTKQLAPPKEIATTGTVLADSTYPGMDRPLALSPTDRLLHVALLGPTGTGKSTLMINMALQDADRGDGLAVLDPKADMVDDLLRHLAAKRHADVILVNPADVERPVGFNVLANDGTEAGRELAVDHVLHVFREQWKEFWGPRTDAVLRAALLVLVSVPAADGSAFTVCELPALLTDDGFRYWVTGQPEVPAGVHDFWRWFENLSSGERTQVVGPVLNKLTALTQRTPLRLLLGQSTGLDLPRIMQQRQILAMPLSRGLMGAETAALLSSLMMSSLWQAGLGRVRMTAAQRAPFFLYVDEASEVVRLPVDLADLMAEARGLKIGLTMATQHLSQLPTAVRNALLATVRSQVIFQVEPADARVLRQSFAPSLDEADLRNLPAYEVALRLAASGQTARPTTGRTRPLPEPTSDGAALRERSRQQFGVARAEVEAGLRDRLVVPGKPAPNVGRRPSRGGRPGDRT